MTLADWLQRLRRLGIRVTPNGDTLKVQAPPGTLSGELKEQLQSRKAELLAYLAASQTAAHRPGPTRLEPRGPGLPLSSAERRMWLLDQLAPHTALYNNFFGLKLGFRFELELFQASVDAMVRRHEILRTVYALAAAGPERRLLDQIGVEVRHFDLTSLDASACTEQLARIERAHAREPFDLETGPLLRLALVNVTADDHRLLVTQHHIITDGRSTAVLFDELFDTYRRLASGEAISTFGPSLQYADYASWEHSRLGDGTLEYQRAFWQEKLQGLPDLELPVDRPGSSMASFEGAIVSHTLPSALSTATQSFAQREGTTLFVVLAAALTALLHRYSGQADFGIGIVSDGRNRDELSDMLGVFINTLVLRSTFVEETSFRDYVDRVRSDVLSALDHQEIPFEEVSRRVLQSRAQASQPLVRVCLVVESKRATQVGATLYADSVDSSVDGTAKFDLYIAMVESEHGIECSFQYRSALFDRSTIATLAQRFETFLTHAVRDSAQPISAIALLEADEVDTLRRFGAGPQVALEEGLGIHHAFERKVLAHPERTALDGPLGLSYRELNEKANQLARVLQKRGVGPEARVAVLLQRGPALVVAVLAILKAGGAYVPLDPSYPRDRLDFMWQDSGASVLVSELAQADLLPDAADRSLYLDDPAARIAEELGSNLDAQPCDEQLAYVIYTSGSTGTPKGVMIEHAQVRNFFAGMDAVVPHEAEGTWLAVTSLSFDISVLELLWTLARGFRVVVDNNGAAGPVSAARLIREHQVTHLQATPALFSMLLADAAGREALASLSHVFVGGEALPVSLAEELAQVLRGSLTNMYGPTETTVWSTTHRIEECSGPIPIGRPIANTRCYVLDATLGHVPLGARGELYIGGNGVARGYLGKDELTRSRFVQDPFVPGARIYRTGDIARFRNDGSLEFFGRVDDQVKLHGHRIELGEIEAAIDAQPEVARSTVVVAGAGGLEKLVAYWVQAVDSEVDVGTFERRLRQALAAKLPQYMLPSSFVRLDAFPTTPNGKVDRKALKARSLPRVAFKPTAQHSRTGDLIADIWREALGQSAVDIDTPFFEAGGHSMLLVQVHRRLVAALGRAIPLTKLFEHPTVRSLADYLDREGAPATAPNIEIVAPKERGDVAIVGMAGRFPGAANLGEFWQNLKDGVESITRFSEAELLEAGVPWAQLHSDGYVPAKGYLAGADLFDADFFDVSARDAVLTDPQQRVFLECAHTALEDAGHVSERFAGAIGVFAGSAANTYVGRVLGDSDWYRVFIHNDKDFLATRVAYKLNLRGPAVAIQTACSTSLVTVIMACQSLWRGECDMALAGGVSVSAPLKAGYVYREGMIFSPDGHCRPFDADGRGTLAGNGVGIVVLRRLEDALRDGDRIDAIIKGGAVNNDGAHKVHFTAPSVAGQAEVIAKAHAIAGVPSASIGYVEAHGTATELGDPIEVAALRQVFEAAGAAPGACALGSVKSNVGHLDTAAGIAGLIKAVLAVKHATLPASLHYQRPNPELGLEGSPFYVNRATQPWSAAVEPRRAAVSSFGIGGTNAHLVLEQPPARQTEVSSRRSHHVLCLSARSEAALLALAQGYKAVLELGSESLADICFTAASGRRHHAQRLAVTGSDHQELADKLGTYCERPSPAPHPAKAASGRRLGCVCGAGSVEDLKHLRELREEADALEGAWQELESVFGAAWFDTLGLESSEGPARARQALAQAVLLWRLWSSWGLRPDAVLGVGVGRLAAAWVSGSLSLLDAAALATSWDADALASAGASYRETLQRLAVSAPTLPWISGEGHSVDSEAAILDQLAALAAADDLALALETARSFELGVLLPLGTDTKPGTSADESEPASAVSWLPTLGQPASTWGALFAGVADLYERGVPLDWHAVTRHGAVTRVALPTYPFERKRYWSDAPSHFLLEPGRAHPTSTALLGSRAAVAEDTHFTTVLNVDRQPLLLDHIVFGEVLVPGAYYLSGMHDVGAELFPGETVALSDVLFHSALVVRGDVALDTVLRPEAEGRYAFQVYSRPFAATSESLAGPWVKHASGKLVRSREGSSVGESLGDLRLRCAEPVAIHAGDDSAQAQAVKRGPSFQWTTGVWVSEGEALLRFECPDGVPLAHAFPPGLVDSIWGCALAAALKTSGSKVSEGPFLPFSVGAMRWLGPCPRVVWGHGRLNELTSDHIVADLKLYSDSGELVALLDGVVLRHAPRQKLVRDDAASRDLAAYRVDWRERELTATPNSPLHGTWFVCGDHDEFATTLTRALEQRGAQVLLLPRPSEQSVALSNLTTSSEEIGGVIDLRPCQSASADVFEATPSHLETSLGLVQILAARTPPPPLFVVTRGALATGTETQLGVDQASHVGLLLSLRAERSDWSAVLVDLEPGQAVEGEVASLLRELAALADGEALVALRSQRRLVARLARHELDAATRLELDAGSSYVVSGGLGALGLRICRWLVEHGARRVALLGRSGETDATRPILAELRRTGADISVFAVDVASRPELEQSLAIVARGAPIRGVLHLAGALDDALLENQTWQRFTTVTGPKLKGAVNLHELTLGQPLDFFVMFSSIASLFGARGQSNYAAANAALDGLAELRHQRGLPALSIHWGPWAGGGMAAGLEAQAARTSGSGMRLLDPDQALLGLERALATATPARIALFAVDWRVFLGNMSERAVPSLLADWAHLRDTTERAEGALLTLARSTPPARREAAVFDYLQKRLQVALGLSVEQQIPPDQPLQELGLDSLMALEVRDQLSRLTGVRLPATLLFDYPVLEQLCRALLERMPLDDGAIERPESPHAASPATSAFSVEPLLAPLDWQTLSLEQAIEELHLAYREVQGQLV